MEVKKSSWHYRLYKWFWEEEPTSLCPYFWKTLLALVFGPICKALIFTLKFASEYSRFIVWSSIIVFFGVTAGPTLYSNYLSGQLLRDLTAMLLFMACMACILFSALGVVWLSLSIPKIYNRVKSTDTWQLFYGYYRAVKDKVCPLITVVD